MDRVRFGRALGVGARAAARSLMNAAEAAAAPSPEPQRRAEAARPPVVVAPARRTVMPRVSEVPSVKLVRAQAGNLKRSVWSPFAKFSSVLWLEVTGTFFAIFALIAGQQAMKNRAAFRMAPNTVEAQHLYVYMGLLGLFGYFALTSFVRASRRQRR